MTKNYEIILQYIQDLSVEIPSAETFVYSREYITKYSLGINITNKTLKNEIKEDTTKKYSKKVVEITKSEFNKHQEFLKKEFKRNFF